MAVAVALAMVRVLLLALALALALAVDVADALVVALVVALGWLSATLALGSDASDNLRGGRHSERRVATIIALTVGQTTVGLRDRSSRLTQTSNEYLTDF